MSGYHHTSSSAREEQQKTPLHVEVRLRPGTVSCTETQVKQAVERLLKSRTILPWRPRTQQVSFEKGEDAFLDAHVELIQVCESSESSSGGGGEREREGCHGRDSQDQEQVPLLFWQVELKLFIYQLSLDDPAEEIEGDEDIASFTEYCLPSVHFEGMWENLQYEDNVKQQLLNYSRSAFLFSHRQVDRNIISWNRLVLLHGPPGTGKTSLCKALAHKLSLKYLSTEASEMVNFSKLIEINAHSLFSKWFSESGKLVSKLFQQIRDLAELSLDLEDGGTWTSSGTASRSLVFVLIDEVESLAVARKQSIQGGEPSDGIRAVNALLTQLDQLKAYPNVYVMCTSNVSDAIDEAFLDRADLKIHLGNPSIASRYSILSSCLEEMNRCGIISDQLGSHPGAKTRLWQICESLDGESGRQLRKLPFLSFSKYINSDTCELQDMLTALANFVKANRDSNEIPNSLMQE